ncbi:sensor histidine kinase [Marinobacter halotolerans]|uniref:sensor histidine kinase n=1 Tax=Marinobacter halotolerans TaxID=1569211 RepID=UPI0012467FC9|nr:ATP-binding protein [Marinobacter halotolerans]
MAPRQRFLLITVLAILAIAVSAQVSLSSPWLGLELSPHTSPDGLRVESVHRDSPNAGVIPVGSVLVAVETADGTRIQLDGNLVMEEPDLLSYSDLNLFMQRQTDLDRALRSGNGDFVLDSGERVPAAAIDTPWQQLTGGFAVHTFYGLIALLVAVGIWAFRPQSVATRLYAMSGVATMVNTLTLAIYGDREFILSGDVFETVAAVNHLATLMVNASLVSLFWVYPRPLARFPVPTLMILIALAMWVLSELQVGDSAQLTVYLPVVVGYVLGLIFAGAQWVASRGRPLERAALKWCVLAIFLGSILLMGLVIIPPAFGYPPLVPLLVGFGAYLILYLGIAAGLVRYRLFDIERWWFKTWLWFAGGLMVLVLDAVLIMGAGLTSTYALTLSLAIAGWVYFPLRQWLWARFGQRTGISLNEALRELVDKLFSATTEAEVRRAWPDLLRMTFQPLSLQMPDAMGQQEAVVVSGDGVLMEMPPLPGDHQRATLEFASNGARLFNKEDMRVANLLYDLTGKALQALQARDAGAERERSRIMRDLHDDLGARLLSLVYVAETDNVREVARSALADLHGLVDTASGQAVSLVDVANACEGEVRQRLNDSGIDLEWQGGSDLPDQDLSARAATNIARIVREAISNIIKHSGADRVQVVWRIHGGQLTVRVQDNGRFDMSAGMGDGHGLKTMQVRARDLGGSVEWRTDPGEGFEIELQMPAS